MSLLDVFRPKWKHSDRNVRRSVARTVDLETARTMADTDVDSDVRDAAKRRFQELVAATVRDYKNQLRDRVRAVSLLDDQQTLAEFADGHCEQSVTIAAIQRISDPLLLADSANKICDWSIAPSDEVIAAILVRLRDDTARASFSKRFEGRTLIGSNSPW